MVKDKKMKKIGVALGSGGAKGLAHIYFLKVFDEMGIRPSMISGTSMGALIGALYASGLSAGDIETLYSKMSRTEMTKLIDFSLTRKHGLVKGHKLMSWFENISSCKTFDDLKIPLKVVATDFWSRKAVVIEEGSLSDAVRASISIPGIFEPKQIGNTVLVDGGLSNPVPYDLLRDECDIIVAIDVLGSESERSEYHELPSIFECIVSSFQIMHASIEKNKEKGAAPHIHVRLSLPTVGILEFHRLSEVSKQVEEEVSRFRKELEKQINL